jgi:hypothetical protein
MKLFSHNKVKTDKGSAKGYETYIIFMSPYTENVSGINLCPMATKGCVDSCLNRSGLGGIYTNVQNARRRKADFFITDRIGFLHQVKFEIERAIKKNVGGAIPVFRLNGTTDISFEKFKVFDGKNIFEIFPDIQFYDYTKNHTRFEKELPSNYHLTFSKSETNYDKCIELLSRGVNVAMVFNKVPNEYNGFKVINADIDDLRFLDERGVICGLKYRNITGSGANNSLAYSSGFAIKVQDASLFDEL